MLDFWFNLPVPTMFGVLAAADRRRNPYRHVSVVAASGFKQSYRCSAPAVYLADLLFGLLTGFLAADINDAL